MKIVDSMAYLAMHVSYTCKLFMKLTTWACTIKNYGFVIYGFSSKLVCLCFDNIASNPQMKHCLCSISFLQGYCLIKSSEYLCETLIGRIKWGIGQKCPWERQRATYKWREKERWLNLEVVWVVEMTISKLKTWVLLAVQINRTNKIDNQKGPQILF